jgi:glucokinase
MTQVLAAGIDIGGTNTSFGIVDDGGHILEKGTMPTAGYKTVEEYIAALQDKLMPMITRAGMNNMKGIGVGAPNGNYHTGEIAYAPNLPWKGIIPFAQLVRRALGLNVSLTNDAKAAAIGEKKFGVAQDMTNFIMVTLGTGLGSGFVANGQIIYGDDGFAGEMGHITAVRDGRKCNCGKLGCLERYASATGIVITAEEWLDTGNVETVLRPHKGKISAKMIHKAADAGDTFALELFEFTGKILGQSLADMVAITSPEAIIFFGGLAKAGDLLLSPTKKHMEANLLGIYKGKVKLLLSGLPDSDAAIVGASALV